MRAYPQQAIQQQIAPGLFGAVAVMHQLAGQPQPGTGSGRQGAEIGLFRSGYQHAVTAVCHRLAKQKFQTADLVSTRPDAGHVIPLDQRLHTGLYTKTGHGMQRCRAGQQLCAGYLCQKFLQRFHRSDFLSNIMH